MVIPVRIEIELPGRTEVRTRQVTVPEVVASVGPLCDTEVERQINAYLATQRPDWPAGTVVVWTIER